MTHVNTTKSEIFAFMAMKSGFMRFSTHFHGIFMKKRFIVVWQKGLKKKKQPRDHLFQFKLFWRLLT